MMMDTNTEKETVNGQEKTNSTGKSIKKKALGAAAAITTGTAVLVNGVFGSPEEMLNPANEANKPAIVHYVEEDVEPEEDDLEEEEEEEEGPLSLRERFRRWVWTWPLALRIIIGLPLWGAGWGVCQLAALLWSSFLSPVLQALMSILTLIAVLAGVVGLAGRALFPELPLREVFKKSRLMGLCISAALLEILIYCLPLISTDLTPYSGLIRFLGGALIIAGLLLSMWVTRERRRRYVLAGE